MDAPANALSVVICCYSDRRFSDLRDAVLSVRGQLAPGDELVVVVDHNPGLLGRVRAAFPDLLTAENGGPRGLSGARNAGIAATRGDILVFLDDDAEAAPGMIEALRAVASQPGSLGAVARIVPVWLGPEPRWFPAEFLWTVGCTYEGLRPGPVRNLIGAAMAVRRRVFDAVGGFDTGLGRIQTGLPLGCEETELCIRAGRIEPGGRFHYIPEAVCRHKVPAGRATPRYLAARCYAEGLSKAQLGAIARGREALSSERAYVLRTLPLGVARGLRDAVSRGDGAGVLRAGFIGFGLASTVAGYAVGRARLVLERGRHAPAAAHPAAPIDGRSA